MMKSKMEKNRWTPPVFGVAIALLLAIGNSAYGKWDILPEAVTHKRPASKSRMLWNKEQKVADGAESYFRHEFQIPAKVTGGTFLVYFDDSGTIYLNGEEMSAEMVPGKLRIGKNLLALKTVNAHGPSGLIYYGAITLENGSTVYLHSEPSIKSTAKLTEGWERPEFDDSGWQTALDQGDVLSPPWANHKKLVQDFASPEEKERIASEERRLQELPPGLEKEPAPNAGIVYVGNQPKISIAGKLYDPIMALVEGNDEFNRSFILKANRTGVKLFSIYFSDEHSYRGKGLPIDFTRLDSSVRHALHLNNGSYLELNIIFGRSALWCKENPDELVHYATGPIEDRGALRVERTGRPRRPSAASEKYREHVRNYLHELTEFVNAQPWRNRIYSVRLSYGVYTEWHYYGYHHGPDMSLPMQEKFRAWLKEKYGGDKGLQTAWHDDNARIATAAAPTWKERTPDGILLDPAKSQKTIDFFNCQAEVNADLLLMMARQIKKELPGRLCGAYYGYVFSTQPPEGANVLLDKVIGAPEIDFTSDPAVYDPSVRQAGGSFSHRAIPATSHRYGKLSLIEDDTRFHQLPGIVTEPYATRTPLESQMVARRNFCNMLFNGSGLQINDASRNSGRRPHTFDAPEVLEGIRESIAVLQKASNPGLDSGNDCVLVVDYRERFRRNGRNSRADRMQIYRTYEVLRSLYRSGIAFDVMSLQDYLACKQDYANVILLNLYSPSKTERNELLAKLRRPGVTSIWLTAPGCVDESGFSDQSMSALVGMKLAGAGVSPNVHCLESGCGDPAVGIADKGNSRSNLVSLPAGAVLKVLPDQSRSVFAAVVPNTGKQWQDLLVALGIHAYSAPDNYVRRHGKLLLFHTGTKGRHTISLPEKNGRVVELFSGKEFHAPTIELESEEAGTWLFKLQ